MARHVWTVLCGTMARAEGPRTSISLLNVVQSLTLHSREPIEQSEAGEDVYFSADMQLVSFWVRSDMDKKERGVCRHRIEYPGGDALDQRPELELNLETAPAATTRLAFPAFPFRGLGTYELVTELRQSKGKRQWKEVARTPLVLLFNPVDPALAAAQAQD